MKHFYVMFIPAVWLIAAVTSFYHPGDEYAMFFVSSMAGSWRFFLMSSSSGHPSDMLFSILVIGGVTLAVVGFVMDRAKIAKRIWIMLFAGCFAALVASSILGHPSYHRAIQKNGSLTAYVSAAFNIGIYFSIVLAFAGKGIGRVIRRGRSPVAGESAVDRDVVKGLKEVRKGKFASESILDVLGEG